MSKITISSTYEIDTNGGNIRFSVRVIRKSQQETRLSDTGVTDEEELEKIIAVQEKRHDKTHNGHNQTTTNYMSLTILRSLFL